MVYAHKDGVYRDFGDIQWSMLPDSPNGTKDGWTQVTKEQYDIATDPKKKDFIPPEVKMSSTVESLPTPGAAPAAASEFSDVNGQGAAATTEKPAPSSPEVNKLATFLNAQLTAGHGWGEIFKLYKAEFKKEAKFKTWQALKAAYEKDNL